MNKKQEEEIEEVMYLHQIALADILAASAAESVAVSSAEALRLLRRGKYTIAEWEGINDRIIEEYSARLNEGGSMCVDRVLEELPGGKVAVSTRRVFVPWLSDMRKRESAEIITLIAEAEAAGVHPRNIAKQLEDKFAGTAHNALTAARTEAQKLRSDARSEYFREAGVEYVQYISADDDRTRPEHAARHGKIYRHRDAPWLGEYNCRCTLAPADYLVNRKGAKVEESQVEILPQGDISE